MTRRAVPTVSDIALAIVLTACGSADDGAASTARLTSPSAGDQSPSPTEPLATATPEARGTPAGPGSDVTGGDGDEPAPTSELSTRVGEDVSFSAVLTEVIGAGAVAVTAAEGGADPVLVHGPAVPSGEQVGASVDVAGSVVVFDAASARARLGADVVPEGLERFDGTPAVLTR